MESSLFPDLFSCTIVTSFFCSITRLATDGVKIPSVSSSLTCFPRISSGITSYKSKHALLHQRDIPSLLSIKIASLILSSMGNSSSGLKAFKSSSIRFPLYLTKSLFIPSSNPSNVSSNMGKTSFIIAIV